MKASRSAACRRCTPTWNKHPGCRDIDDGGARHNRVECSFVGLANLVDSLNVIRNEVYRDATLTLAELKEVLDADFKGHDEGYE